MNGFDYIVYASNDTNMKCFKCRQFGHLVRAYSERVNVGDDSAERPAIASIIVKNFTVVVIAVENECNRETENSELVLTTKGASEIKSVEVDTTTE